jgi:hypothetical protein
MTHVQNYAFPSAIIADDLVRELARFLSTIRADGSAGKHEFEPAQTTYGASAAGRPSIAPLKVCDRTECT